MLHSKDPSRIRNPCIRRHVDCGMIYVPHLSAKDVPLKMSRGFLFLGVRNFLFTGNSGYTITTKSSSSGGIRDLHCRWLSPQITGTPRGVDARQRNRPLISIVWATTDMKVPTKPIACPLFVFRDRLTCEVLHLSGWSQVHSLQDR